MSSHRSPHDAARTAAGTKPLIVAVGLGPAGEELTPQWSVSAFEQSVVGFVRTLQHPAARDLVARMATFGREVRAMDRFYEAGGSFEQVYQGIVEELVAVAGETGGPVAYALPGSPLVAERTVEMLRTDERIELRILPAPSFLDLAWDRLGVDPLSAGVRLVDGARFEVEAAGERGPLLVAQCHSPTLLSEVKLAADDLADDPERSAVILHHLGLDDELVMEVPWSEIDRTVVADHLTSLWVPANAPRIAAEVARLAGLSRLLRQRCPWDARQTHASLERHLVEETYELLEAIDALQAGGSAPSPGAVDHFEEELGDLLFQVVIHCQLASEEGWFTLADVAGSVHEKLVGRHPHVFGDVVADTAEDVAHNWEEIKKVEKKRDSPTDGIPWAMPALALAAKLMGKARSAGLAAGQGVPTSEVGIPRWPGDAGSDPAAGQADQIGDIGQADQIGEIGEVLLGIVSRSLDLGVDPEGALRQRLRRLREEIDRHCARDGASSE